MPYSTFTLETIQTRLGLTITSVPDLFAGIQATPVSEHLRITLVDQVPLALINLTEKARSELIIAPILVDVWRSLDRGVTLFSGVTFDVAPSDDLVGVCDFLISAEQNAMIVNAPIVAIVEAKRDDIGTGLGQCAAELIAALRVNGAAGDTRPVHGAVTIGTLWRFMRVDANRVEIDQREYGLDDLGHILAILRAMCMRLN